METSTASRPPAPWLKRLAGIEPGEARPALASFLLVFVLMAAWYILKPVRDAMASDWSDQALSWLWTTNLVATLVLNVAYAAALSALSLRVVVPAVYALFAASFAAFALAPAGDAALAAKAFYVWVSVFSLFHVSVFWSFMADLWDRAQARRLFGFIAAGASAGGLVGPLVPLLLAGRAGQAGLMGIGAVLLAAVVPLVAWLGRQHHATSPGLAATAGPAGGERAATTAQRVGGNPFAGFTQLVRSPFLLGIAVFLFFYTSLGSFIYFELKHLLAPYAPATRTQVQSAINWAINACTLLTAVLATGRLAVRFGMGATLALVPVLLAGGLVAVAAVASAWIMVLAQVVLKAGNYAITRPAREMLFTLVDREQRYKTKPVIDTLVYRVGDSLSAWSFTALSEGLALGAAALALAGAAIAAAWAGVGLLLGRAARQRSRHD